MTLTCALDISVRWGSFSFRYHFSLIVWATIRSSSKNGLIWPPPRLIAINAVTFSEWSGLVSTLSVTLEPQVNHVARVHMPAEPEVHFVSEPETVEVWSDRWGLIWPLRTIPLSSHACSCPLLSASDKLVSCMNGGAGLCAGWGSARSVSVWDFEPGALQISPGYPGWTAPPVGGSPLSGPNEVCRCPVSCETACHIGIR